jgi:type I restriction enzyme S subunit
MSEWKEYKLNDVIDTLIDYRGKTPPKTDSGMPLVTAKIVKGGRIQPPTEFISLDFYDNWMTRGLPKCGDLVLTSEAPLGEVAQIKDENIALAQRIILLRGKANVCDTSYLKYYFISPEGNNKLQSRATGTTVEGIKQSALRQVAVVIPDYPTQRAIAEVLSSLDDKIDLLTRQNATLEALAQTYFRQWFVEGSSEELEEEKILDLIDFNPSRKLSKGTNAPYLEMSDLSNNAFNPIRWNLRDYSSGTRFINNDTLLARITPCLENGKTAYITFLNDNVVAWGSTEFIVMRPKIDIHPFFAYCLARYTDFREYAIGCMEGSSGRQRVNTDHLANYPFKIPNVRVVEKFNATTAYIEPKLRSNSMQILTLQKLRDTLLPKLISGEVRVKQEGNAANS